MTLKEGNVAKKDILHCFMDFGEFSKITETTPGHAASPIPSQGSEGVLRKHAAAAQSPQGADTNAGNMPRTRVYGIDLRC